MWASVALKYPSLERSRCDQYRMKKKEISSITSEKVIINFFLFSANVCVKPYMLVYSGQTDENSQKFK